MGKKNNDLSIIIEKLDEIKEMLNNARELLANAKDSKNEPIDNVSFITPHIHVEYEEFKINDERNVVGLLEKYQTWAFEICTSISANKGKLKNKKLRTHLSNSLLICESLDFSFRTVFNDKK